jgi:hypothetical protein
MEREIYINGRPLFWVDTKGWTLAETEKLSRLYGVHALKLFGQIYAQTRDFPLDILSVGDNWCQLNSLNPPESEEGARLYSSSGGYKYAIWPIRKREFKSNGDGSLFILDSPVEDLLYGTELQIRKGKRNDERIIQKLGVIDFTSIAFPVFPNPENLEIMPFPYSWGRRLFMTGYATEISYVTDIRLQGQVQA